MSKNSKKIPVELKTINTPKGAVPTADSFQSLVDGLNILDTELESIKEGYLTQIEEIKREIKSMKKLVAEETVSLESVNQRLKQTNERLAEISAKSQLSEDKQSIKALNDKISQAVNEIVSGQKKLEESLVKSIESLSKIIGMKLSLRKGK